MTDKNLLDPRIDEDLRQLKTFQQRATRCRRRTIQDGAKSYLLPTNQ